MVNLKSFSLLVSLIILASCAPLEQQNSLQTQLDVKAPQVNNADDAPKAASVEKAASLETTDGEVITPDNQTALDNQSALDNQTAFDEQTVFDNGTFGGDEIAADNQTASIEISIAEPQIGSEKDEEIETAQETDFAAEDNMTSAVIEESAPEEIQKIPAPKPIEPLNPVIFTGLNIQNLEKRLGRPDRQFNEQALDVWHYEEPHCHALFFIHNRGDSAEVMHVDVRPAILQTALNRQVCFADFGQRAEALLDRDKR